MVKGLAEEKDLIIEAVLKVYGLTINQLKSRNRSSNIAQARFVVWEHLYDSLGMTLTEIGRELGRHPSDVIHGMRRIKVLRKENRIASRRSRKVKQLIGGKG